MSNELHQTSKTVFIVSTFVYGPGVAQQSVHETQVAAEVKRLIANPDTLEIATVVGGHFKVVYTRKAA